MFRKCKHKWEVLINERSDTPLGEAVRKGNVTKISYTSPRDLRSYLTIILGCAKCGKLNKTVQELG